MARLTRIGIAGLLGGLAMFAWASVAHMATPLDDLGLSALPNETTTRTALLAQIGMQPGLYQFPAKTTLESATTNAQKATLAERPYGLLLYHPPGPGAAGLAGSQIFGELLLEIVESLIAAALLAAAALTRYGARVAFVAGVGLAAVLTTNGSYWIFYGFPTDYTLGYGFTDLVRYVCAGLVMAAILKPQQPGKLA